MKYNTKIIEGIRNLASGNVKPNEIFSKLRNIYPNETLPKLKVRFKIL